MVPVAPLGTAAATYGGYSQGIVVDDHFVLRLSPKLDPAAAAPLLCAGITLDSPLKHWGAGPGKRVGIVGLGGLGHQRAVVTAIMSKVLALPGLAVPRTNSFEAAGGCCAS